MSYLGDLFFIFNLIFTIIGHIISFKQTYLLFIHFFLNISNYFWMITWMKKAKKIQIAKAQPQVLLSCCLIFYQFQPSIVYKSVAYKKIVYTFTRFFYISNHFFFQLSLSVAYVFHELSFKYCLGLLNTYNHHYTEAHFIFNLFGSMYRRRSILYRILNIYFSFSASFSLPLLV